MRNIKRKMAAGQPAVVVNPDHPDAGLVEFLGGLPIDAVFIDCEQGSPDVQTVEHMARAARLTHCPSLVRLFASDDWVIERYMGRGVDGIVVPRLDHAKQAQHVVDAVRYCFPRDSDKKIVVVQIETRRALETLDDFLAIDGIDTYFLGPVDLSKSLGFAGDYRRPEMQSVLDDAIVKIKRAGKASGILVDHSNVQRYVQAGVQFLYTHANEFLQTGATSFAALTCASSSVPLR